MRSEDAISILKSMALNYPIIHDWGFRLSHVIKVIVPIGCTRSLLDSIYTPSSVMISPSVSSKELERIVSDTNSGFIFMLSTGDKKKDCQRLNYLKYFVQRGEKVVFVYLVESAQVMNDRDLFTIQLEDTHFECPKVDILVPKPADLTLIHDIVTQKCCSCEMSEVEKTLKTSVVFLYPKLSNGSGTKVLDDFFRQVELICEYNEAELDSDTVSESFIKAMYRSCDEGKIEKAIMLPNISDFENVRTTSVFYDKDYVYMSLVLFNTIVEEMHLLPLAVKQALDRAGILLHDTGEYSVKMSFWNPYGIRKRVRMMKFEATKLVLPGEMFIIDMLTEEGEKNVDESGCA